ncbi:PDZ domain-containing protein 11-like [Lingula anatina]|nr:PDZ domain-containing protein 11-like [Lingula anatina]|eukprot:XP_013403617.1 PDZ domain-containing protein 11-like [Lingula anatina]
MQGEPQPAQQNQTIQAELPAYELPPKWIPLDERQNHPDYNNDLRKFLPRALKLRRNKTTDQLGFNVRGGREHNCGIYISKVLPNTDAQRLGLKEGDQIITVNEADFLNVEHAEAVKILKRNLDVQLTVRYFPYGYDRTYGKIRPLRSATQ